MIKLKRYGPFQIVCRCNARYRRVPILGAPLTFSFSSPFLGLQSGALTIGVRLPLGSGNRYKKLVSMDNIIGISCMIFHKITCKLSCFCFLSRKQFALYLSVLLLSHLPDLYTRQLSTEKYFSICFSRYAYLGRCTRSLTLIQQ